MSLRLTVYKALRWTYRKCSSGLKKSLLAVQKGVRGLYYRIDSTLFPQKSLFSCPCCDARFRRFKANPYTIRTDYFNPDRYKGQEQHIICPVCESLPRHRILATWLESHKSELKGKILYFAIEDGICSWFKRNGIDVTTADLYTDADLKLDIENTGLADGTWDLIVCNHVLEHVNDYRKALQELHRILKADGRLIVSFPIDEILETVKEDRTADEKERIRSFGQIDHWRLFGRDSKAMLRAAGFTVSVISGNGLQESIRPYTGPADYDVNYLFLCERIEKQQTDN